MLQQTTVQAVLPYYDRFLRRFPDVASLARARVSSVLAAWSGLGYYRRARHLHAAARRIRDLHQGRFPTRFEEILALPGVGRYTAGAIASIAFGQQHPILDGNVARRQHPAPVERRDLTGRSVRSTRRPQPGPDGAGRDTLHSVHPRL
jgi:A/G-specific adenine glycosylase